MIINNGLKINNKTVSSDKEIIAVNSLDQDNNIKISHGKKKHVIVKVT